MRITEFENNVDTTKLVALGQFLLGRAGDTGAKKTISVDSFIGLARDMGIALTAKQLRDLAGQEPLNNIIANIQGDEIIFQGSEEYVPGADDTMTTDQARATVDKMAKRALK